MLCCQTEMHHLATAEDDNGDRVTIHACLTCLRLEVTAQASSPHWVSARARNFLKLREEAFQSAGIANRPATCAVINLATQQVIFG